MSKGKDFNWVWQGAVFIVGVLAACVILVLFLEKQARGESLSPGPLTVHVEYMPPQTKDEWVKERLELKRHEDRVLVDKATDYVVGVLGVAPIAYSLFQEDRWKRTAWNAGILGVSTGFNQFSKWLVERPRPNTGEPVSFFSGHSSLAFTGATLLLVQAGPGLGVPALVLASTVPVGRIMAGKHWMTDTVFGVIFGTVWGLTVAVPL